MELIWILIVIGIVSYFSANSSSENESGENKSRIVSKIDKIRRKKNQYIFSLKKGKTKTNSNLISIKVNGSSPYKHKSKNLMVQISLHDITTKNITPVYSTHQLKQEDTTESFYYTKKMKQSYNNSTTLTNIDTTHLLTSTGKSDRKIQITIRLIDNNKKINIKNGNVTNKNNNAVLQTHLKKTTVFLENEGYNLNFDRRIEGKLLALKAGMAVAMSDGYFDYREKDIIEHWIRKHSNSFVGGSKKTAIQKLETVYKTSYYAASNKQIKIPALTKKVKELNSKNSENEMINLVHSVMEADGEIDANEIALLESISTAFDVTKNDIENITTSDNQKEKRLNDKLAEHNIDTNQSTLNKIKAVTNKFAHYNDIMNFSSPEEKKIIQSKINDLSMLRTVLEQTYD